MNKATEIAKEILEKEQRPLNPNQMYKIAENLGLTEELNFKGKTPWATFGARIYEDLKNNSDTIFEKVQEKPILIKLKKQNFFANDKVVNNSEILSDKLRNIRFKERDLHPILAYFINSNPNFNALPKTIYHEISQKNSKGLDKWLYPDMVGVSFEKFNNDETYKFLEKFQNIPVKFYSFEIKKEINVSNFREYYFQAVSNSSWANEGYLVALDIDESDEELTMLITKTALSFGIGVLSLDSENIDQSKIIAPAKFKELLDFSLIDELSQKNKNFQNFIKTVNEYDIKNEIRYKGEFDKILNSEEIKQYMLEKNIKRT
ncbi:HTH domain-containing protein [Campylobacter hominis]